MFNQYESNVKATIKFLKLLNVKVAGTTVNETLQNHPEWPSLLCISDSLNKWNVPNGAGRINLERIEELPVPFIAHTSNREFPLAIVTKVLPTSIHQLSKDYKKETTVGREEFLKTWDGIYLFAEPNNESGEENYRAIKYREWLNSLVPIGTFILLIFLSTYAMFGSLAEVRESRGQLAIPIFLHYFISLIGVIVTSLLLWYEIDKNNPLLQKVCTGIVKGNCNAILTGKAAKVFSWLSWSEVGFFYFSGCLLTLLFLPSGIIIVSWLGILALPYTVFSIYYQWRIAKQWCVLCLAVQALLLLGGVNILTNDFLSLFESSFYLHIFNGLALFALPVLVWYSAKPFILKLQEAKSTKRQYLRLKFDIVTFETLLKKQKKITMSTGGMGIDIGNQNAYHEIIKVCNPYCGPCAKAHPKIDEIVEHNRNVRAKIIFTVPNDENNKALKPVKHLLAIAAQNDEHEIKKALDDWYLPDEKDYKAFAEKYKVNEEFDNQNGKIEEMYNWCKAIDIAYTPTIFLNGYQLPDAYSVEDLEYILLELSNSDSRL